MIHRCEECKRNFHNQESLNQHNTAKHGNTQKKAKINTKKYLIFIAVGLIVILGGWAIMNYMQKPGDYDSFAQCLSEKGAIVYGNDFCSYTIKQLNFFGKSKQYLNYVKCSDNEALCDSKNVQVTPTWEIDGKMYPQVQDFQMLSSVSGCSIS